MDDESRYHSGRTVELTRALKALAHPVRLEILKLLAGRGRQCCCTDVKDCLPLAQSTVSQHLRVLLDAGFIVRHPQGNRNCYTVDTGRLESVSASLGMVLNDVTAAADKAPS